MLKNSSNYLSVLNNNWQNIIDRNFEHSLDKQKVCTLAEQSSQIKQLKEKYPQINVQINQQRQIKPLKNGIYIGSLNSEGKPSGYGIIRYEDKSMVEANFANGKANGKGLKYFGPKWYYVGDFVDNNFDGRGQYISPEICYIGQFRNNIFHGQGQLKLIYNNSKFIGTMEEGQMKKGVLTWQLKNPRDSKQILKFQYQGCFENGKFNDLHGVLISNIGVYQGGFKNGVKSGQGKFLFKEKYQYVGHYENNVKKGYGTLFNPDVETINNQQVPKVSTEQKNISYRGQFENNLPHGKGQVYRQQEGRLVQAQYEEGIWVEALRNMTNQ